MSDKKRPIIIAAESSLDDAARVFNSGGVIAYPTETTYGLGVDPHSDAAIERLFAIKGRPVGSPISILVADRGMLASVVDSVPEYAEALIRRFWPGPLTIVFKAGASLPKALTAGTGTVGVRISSSALCVRLLEKLKKPITATSANPSGDHPAVNAAEVVEYFNASVDIVIELPKDDKAGTSVYSKTSTVVDVTGPAVRLIREGAITMSEILGQGRR